MGQRMNKAPTHEGQQTTDPANVADVADAAERERALDVRESFIVRAPAGSGKTRLLIQRYLALLATVDEPEEVIAITFTRKAAAEMLTRVLNALATVGSNADALTHELAQRVLARDAARGWQLLSNAARLRIQTIDSLNTGLTRQMPMLSRFGAQPESVDDASALYRRAARQLLARVNDADEVADDIATLLTHLDNNLNVVEGLIADMLRGRDHWLRNLPRMHQREALEAALSRVRAQAVADVAVLFPNIEKTETLELVRFSGQNLLKEGVDRALSRSANLAKFPSGAVDDLPAWLAIADLLLTNDGTWRKPRGINKTVGFPTSKIKEEKPLLDAMKARIGALLEGLAAEAVDAGDDALAVKLHALRGLPSGSYTAAEWEVLGAIVRLLPHATVHLWDVFGAEGECDFTEIAQAASRALGEDDEPTDLALALDYRIRHLLVDEFQDTSFAQFELLEKLTRGWTVGDGRTLFVVGDPMQSIYRFREAEVGLFLRARHAGLGGITLTPLTLSVNFRSSPGVVGWVNQTFSQLMPSSEDPTTGVVPYSESVAFDRTPQTPAEAVSLHWFVHRKDRDDLQPAILREAEAVVRIIEDARAERPGGSIALLIRNRTHLREIVPALKAAGIVYRAVDIDPLNDRPVVQDLMSLTRALMHASDRIAWLAILRAPWCGLTLNDLAALTHSAHPIDGALRPDPRTVWELLNDSARLDAVSADGRVRALKVRGVMHAAMSTRRRTMLRDAVEQAWLTLAGPACLQTATELDDAMTFLSLLEEEANDQSGGAQIVSLETLSARVERLFSGAREPEAAGDDAESQPPVQIMTIHKAKGLEFETVIVAGLDRPPRKDDKKLLVWTEQADAETGESALLLAPIRETGADDDADAIYQYITKIDRAKQLHEDVRLLYVAATRAERRLHLLASVSVKDKDGVPELVAPKAASLLSALWPAVAPSVDEVVQGADSGAGAEVVRDLQSPAIDNLGPTPSRIAINLPTPTLLASLAPALTAASVATSEATLALETNTPQIDFEWASDTARHVGSVVHLFLHRIAIDGITQWSAARIASARPSFQRELMRLGVGSAEVDAAVDRVALALSKTIDDNRGRWTLGAHSNARSEWRITGLVDGVLVNAALDRTFIDAENVRWIIDFKTGSHEGADVDAFLDNEQRRYRAQLETYAVLLHAMEGDSRPIRLGLYFPMLGGWREWEWN